jgi:transposase
MPVNMCFMAPSFSITDSALFALDRRLRVSGSDTAKGFHVLPKRWIVERTYGWLGRCRRLAKDYENLTRSHVGFVILAMTSSCCAE